jgi:predicted RND superfamily exporter protein
MNKIVSLIYKNKIVFLILLFIISAISILFVKNIGVSNNINVWFPKGEPLLKSYQNFLKDFGNDESIIVALKSGNKFTEKKEMNRLSLLIENFDKINEAEKAISINTFLISNEFKSSLLSEDSLKTIIIIPMNNNPDFEDSRNNIIKEVNKILKKSNYEYHLAGVGIIYDGLNKATQKNGIVFIILSFVFIFIFLLLFLKDRNILFIALFSIFMSITILFAIYSIIDKNVNIVTIILPVLILIYGISDIIYIVYGLKYSENSDIVKSLSEILTPCFLTSLTTAIGFFSLMTSRIVAIKQIGLYGGLGVLIEFFVTLIVMISFSNIIKHSTRKQLKLLLIHNYEDILIKKHSKMIIISFFLFAIIMSYGIKYLNIDTYSIGMLKGNNIVQKDSKWIENNIGNYLPLELLVKTDGNIDNPVIRKNILEFQNDVLNIYGYKSFSYYDLPNLSSLSLFGNYESNIKYYNEKSGQLRITVYIPMLSAKNAGNIRDSLINLYDSKFISDIEASAYLPLYVKLVDYITNSQFKSFPIALITILLFITLLFGLKNGILAILPNILPIVTVLGIMGYFKIPLDVGTVIITPIIIGVVTDDTIHYIYAKKHNTTHWVKQPMLITSILLAFGFLICTCANTSTIMYFGILSSISIFMAYLGDAFLLPSLYYRFGITENHQ